MNMSDVFITLFEYLAYLSKDYEDIIARSELLLLSRSVGGCFVQGKVYMYDCLFLWLVLVFC